MTDASNRPSIALTPSLKRILAGRVPTLIVHKSHQASQRLDEVFSQVPILHGKKVGLGTAVRLPNMSPKTATEFMSRHSSVPLRIVDPELHLNPDGGWPDASGLTKANEAWGYLTAMPTKPSSSWIRQVFSAQLDHGASVLLSATGWVSEVNARKSLDATKTFIDASRHEAGASPMLVNLTMDSRWLSDSALRDLLLQEIVESNEEHWYLRFYWPEVSPRYGQLVDPQILNGYKELASTAVTEGKKVFLPNSGLTGWIASALGASGFSTGQSWPEQAFARQRRAGGRAGQPPPPRIPRLFDSTILHTVEYGEYERLASLSGHKAYDTTFSLEIDTDGHDAATASLHYLMAIAKLQSKLSGARPNVLARQQVRKALRFVDGLDRLDRPTGLNRPDQLSVWDALLK